MYGCYYEAENPSLVGDIPTMFVMALIKTGNVGLAEKLGQFAVNSLKRNPKGVNWDLQI